MSTPRANRRAAVALVVVVAAALWLLVGLHAYGAYADAHNPDFPHVQASLFGCGQSGCGAVFHLDGRRYVVIGVQGRDGDRVTLYVDRQDPYTYAQAEDPLHAYGALCLVALLSAVALGGWRWSRRRRDRGQSSPAARRS